MKPDWALKYKVKNTELRKRGSKYHLYSITSKWDPIKRRTKKVTLSMLGVITEKDGFIPKGQSVKGRPPKDKDASPMECKEFGASNFLKSISSDIVFELKKFYPNDWQTLYILAINRLIYQASLRKSKFRFEASFLSETMKEVNLESDNLIRLLTELGKNRDKIVHFMKHFIEGENHIVFDATHDIIELEEGLLNGYDPKVNMVYMFSNLKEEEQIPTYYRIFPRNVNMIEAFQECLNESNLKDSFVTDSKGVYSEKDIKLFQKAKLKYIIPCLETLKEEKERGKDIEGMVALQTNSELSPKNLYTNYQIRVVAYRGFNMYKSILEEDRKYLRNTELIEGWMFLNHITMMMYYRIYNLLETKKIFLADPKELLEKLADIRKIKVKQKWILAKINSETEQLIEKLSISKKDINF